MAVNNRERVDNFLGSLETVISTLHQQTEAYERLSPVADFERAIPISPSPSVPYPRLQLQDEPDTHSAEG